MGIEAKRRPFERPRGFKPQDSIFYNKQKRRIEVPKSSLNWNSLRRTSATGVTRG